MNNLPKNQREHRQRLYKTEAAIGAAVSLHKSRKRSDNVQLSERVRGRVVTGAARQAVRVTNEADKTGMYEKPACGHLDSEKFLRRRSRPLAERDTSRLRVPADASADEQAKMSGWLAQADAISAHLNR